MILPRTLDPRWLGDTRTAWLELPASGELVGPTGGGVGLVVVVVGGGVVVVAVEVVVLVVVVVPVVVPLPWTTTVPVMNGCASQWNVYVPGWLNVHDPLHPGPVAACGSGGTDPLLEPAVCVHELGSLAPKSALWTLAPVG